MVCLWHTNSLYNILHTYVQTFNLLTYSCTHTFTHTYPHTHRAENSTRKVIRNCKVTCESLFKLICRDW